MRRFEPSAMIEKSRSQKAGHTVDCERDFAIFTRGEFSIGDQCFDSVVIRNFRVLFLVSGDSVRDLACIVIV